MMKIFVFVIVCLLSGCSPYKHSFNCPVPKGYPCTSMTRIHELIDEGVFTTTNTDVNCKTCSSGSCHSKQASTSQATGTQNWVEVVIVGEHDVRKYVINPQGDGK